ncbi:hypothetical protein ACFL16_00415 [Patescibacteria group bacterium]
MSVSIKVQLVGDLKASEKVPFEEWLRDFMFWLNIVSMLNDAEKYQGVNISWRRGYCNFFNQECSKCSLDKYVMKALGQEIPLCGDRGVINMLLYTLGGNEQDFQAYGSIYKIVFQIIKQDGIRWGYYASNKD